MIILRNKFYSSPKSPKFKPEDDINFWKKYENKDLSKVSDEKLKALAKYEKKNPDDVIQEVKKIAAKGMGTAGIAAGVPIGLVTGAIVKKPIKGAAIGGLVGAVGGAAAGAHMVGRQHRKLKKVAKEAREELKRRNN